MFFRKEPNVLFHFVSAKRNPKTDWQALKHNYFVIPGLAPRHKELPLVGLFLYLITEIDCLSITCSTNSETKLISFSELR